jgi:hypothetical protein
MKADRRLGLALQHLGHLCASISKNLLCALVENCSHLELDQGAFHCEEKKLPV